MKLADLNPKHFLFLAIPIYAITAFFSVGFHHFDEHYQILEFANYLLGNIESSTLPWEFEARIRPSIQAFMAAGLIGFMDLIGITNPFNQTVIIRLLCSAFVLLTVYKLNEVIAVDFSKKAKNVLAFTSYLVFFFPYFSARFSSETMGMMAFLWALIILLPGIKAKRININQWTMIGVLCGLSFLFRYQMAVMVGSLGLWLLIVERVKIASLVWMVIGFAIAFLSGIIFDYFLYGEFVISALNYFESNLLEGKAATFGVSPWYYYFTEPFRFKMLSILNGFLLFCMLIHFAIKPKHLIWWLIIPFVLVHSAIGHKEFRFIFPVLYFIPLIFAEIYDKIKDSKSVKLIPVQLVAALVLAFLFAMNGVALYAFAVKPADGQVMAFRTLQENFPGETDVYYLMEPNYNFYHAQGALMMHYYQTPIGKMSICEPDSIEYLPSGSVLFAKRHTIIENPELLEPPVHIVSDFILNNNRNNWMKIKNANWVIYQRK